MWHPYNPNPCGVYVGDCVIRALSIALDKPWEKIYVDLCVEGLMECDMPNANHVWGKYMSEHGFICSPVQNIGDVTVSSFAKEHYQGVYVLATGVHVVALINGDYWDAWDSGNEHPIMIWKEI